MPVRSDRSTTPTARRQLLRPSASSAPAITGRMLVDHDSAEKAAVVQWSTKVPAWGYDLEARTLDASYYLFESGRYAVFASIRGVRAADIVTFIDGDACEPREIAALGRALVTLAERAAAERDAALARLAEWRSRYDEALEPLEVEAGAAQ